MANEFVCHFLLSEITVIGLGMQFSILEQRVILSMLLRRFKWSLANPNETLGFEPPGLLVPKALNIKFELVE